MRRVSPWAPALLGCPVPRRRCISDARPFVAGDLVLLRQTQNKIAPPILTRPLQPGGRIDGHQGFILHEEIIGKRVRDIVKSTTTRSERSGRDFRLHDVTLDEYVRLSRRLVTPIYPSDANFIVGLLDLHPDATDTDLPRLEILEAGTGHGALTLHLSRAIHAANAARHDEENMDDRSGAWKEHRRAVLHTVEVSPHFSAHAQKVVQGFRRGMYARNIDFHVGDVADVIESMRESRGTEPFLSHVFLDLPSAHRHLAAVANVLRTGGKVIVFYPSVTQVVECANQVKNERMPLELERVLELGTNASSGGREWDVRFVRPRAMQRAAREEAEAAGEDGEETGSPVESAADSDADVHLPTTSPGVGWSVVCRPKVGDRITGGGFLGVWHKQRETSFKPVPRAGDLEEGATAVQSETTATDHGMSIS